MAIIARMRHPLVALALAAIVLAATAVLAQSQPRYGCDSPESRQLDFWVGDWELTYTAGGKEVRAFGDKGRVREIALAPDGRTLAATHYHGDYGKGVGRVFLWDVTTGTEVAAFRAEMQVNSVAFDESGTRLAAGLGSEGVPGAVRIWKEN